MTSIIFLVCLWDMRKCFKKNPGRKSLEKLYDQDPRFQSRKERLSFKTFDVGQKECRCFKGDRSE